MDLLTNLLNDTFCGGLIRTTLFLSIGFCLVEGFTRLFKISSAKTHQICWLLVLILGWIWVRPSFELKPEYDDPYALNSITVESVLEKETVFKVQNDSTADPTVNYWEQSSFYVPETRGTIFENENHKNGEHVENTENEKHPAVSNTIVEPASILRTVAFVIFTAWFSGICVILFRSYLKYRVFSNLLAETLEPIAPWKEQWDKLVKFECLRKPVPLRVSDKLGPMLVRRFNGYEVVVPMELWKNLESADRLNLLRVELLHLRNRDIWKYIFVRILLLPHWFNPISWMIVRRFDQATKHICDDEVIHHYPEAAAKISESLKKLKALPNHAALDHQLEFSFGCEFDEKSVQQRIDRIDYRLENPNIVEPKMSKYALVGSLSVMFFALVFQVQFSENDMPIQFADSGKRQPTFDTVDSHEPQDSQQKTVLDEPQELQPKIDENNNANEPTFDPLLADHHQTPPEIPYPHFAPIPFVVSNDSVAEIEPQIVRPELPQEDPFGPYSVSVNEIPDIAPTEDPSPEIRSRNEIDLVAINATPPSGVPELAQSTSVIDQPKTQEQAIEQILGPIEQPEVETGLTQTLNHGIRPDGTSISQDNSPVKAAPQPPIASNMSEQQQQGEIAAEMVQIIPDDEIPYEPETGPTFGELYPNAREEFVSPLITPDIRPLAIVNDEGNQVNDPAIRLLYEKVVMFQEDESLHDIVDMINAVEDNRTKLTLQLELTDQLAYRVKSTTDSGLFSETELFRVVDQIHAVLKVASATAARLKPISVRDRAYTAISERNSYYTADFKLARDTLAKVKDPALRSAKLQALAKLQKTEDPDGVEETKRRGDQALREALKMRKINTPVPDSSQSRTDSSTQMHISTSQKDQMPR